MDFPVGGSISQFQFHKVPPENGLISRILCVCIRNKGIKDVKIKWQGREDKKRLHPNSNLLTKRKEMALQKPK